MRQCSLKANAFSPQPCNKIITATSRHGLQTKVLCSQTTPVRQTTMLLGKRAPVRQVVLCSRLFSSQSSTVPRKSSLFLLIVFTFMGINSSCQGQGLTLLKKKKKKKKGRKKESKKASSFQALIWNSLPHHLRCSMKLKTFKRKALQALNK